jgi:hypothetical protein
VLGGTPTSFLVGTQNSDVTESVLNAKVALDVSDVTESDLHARVALDVIDHGWDVGLLVWNVKSGTYSDPGLPDWLMNLKTILSS